MTRLTPIGVALAILLIATPAQARRGALVLELGEDARAEWDPCPLWGEFRIQVWRPAADLADQVEKLDHPAVQAVQLEEREDGSLVLVLRLDADVAGTEIQLDHTGRMTVEPRVDSEAGHLPGLTERLAEILGPPSRHPGETLGYLPLGAASPWSFVSQPLVPAAEHAFLVVAHAGPDGGSASSGAVVFVPTPTLVAAMEARDKATGGADPAWWGEAAGRFQLVASTLEDDLTHEAALALGGEAFYMAGAFDESMVYFDRAAQSFSYPPRYGWHLLGRGMAHQGMGRHELALDDLERAGAALPAEYRGRALVALATTLAAVERMREGNALAAAARRGWPDTPLDRWLEAEMAYRADDPKRAAQLLVRLLDADPRRQHLVLVRLVDCAMMRDDEADVGYWLGELKAEASNRASMVERLRRLEWELLTAPTTLDFPDAIAQLRVLAEADPSAALEVALAEAAFLHHDGMLLDGCRLDHQTLQFHGDFMGRLQVEARMCESAAELIEMAREEDNTVLAAGLYLEYVDRRRAAACSEPELVWDAADDLRELNLADEARRALTSMLSDERVDGDLRVSVLVELADLYREADRTDEGLKTLAYLREAGTSDVTALKADVLEAELLLGAGRIDEAAEKTAELSAEGAAQALAARVDRVVGHVALRQGEWAVAADALTRSRRTARGQVAIEDKMLEAWALYRDSRHDAAEGLLSTLDLEACTSSTREAAIFLRAKVLRARGRGAEAEALLAGEEFAEAPAFWNGLASEESAELLWYRRMDALIGVPTAFDGDATGSPSEL